MKLKERIIKWITSLPLHSFMIGLGLLSAIIFAVFYQSSYFSKSTDLVLIQQRIEAKLQKELSLLQNEVKLIKGKIPALSTQRFSELNDLCNKSIYVFRNGQLYYWNNAKFIPDYHKYQGKDSLQVVWQNDSKYILEHDSIVVDGVAYDIVGYQPLISKFSVRSQQFPVQYGFSELASVGINNLKTQATDLAIKSKNGKVLFYISSAYTDIESINGSYNYLYGILILLATGFLIAGFLALIYRRFTAIGKFQRGFLATLFVVIIASYCLQLIGFPNNWFANSFYVDSTIEVFDFEYSHGDLLINLILLLVVIGYLFRYFLGSKFYSKLIDLPFMARFILSIFLVLGVVGCFFAHYYFLRTIAYSLGEELDVAIPLLFSFVRFMGLAEILLSSLIFFMIVHLLLRMSLAFTNSDFKINIIIVACCTILSFSAYFILDGRYILIMPIGIFFILGMLIFKMPKYLSENKYQSYLYLFLYALSSALIFIYVLRNYKVHNDWIMKEQFAHRIEHEGDQSVESILGDVEQEIVHDSYIQDAMLAPIFNRDNILKKLRASIDIPDLKGYTADFALFWPNGNSIDSMQYSLAEYKRRYGKFSFKTKIANLLLIKNSYENSFKQYIITFPIYNQGYCCGSVLLHFRLRTGTMSNSFPTIFLNDLPALRSEREQLLSYAIYANSERIFNTGNFNYAKYFLPEYLKDGRLYKSGLTIVEAQHRAIRLPNNRVIVVTGPSISIKELLANGCFVLLFLSISLLTWMLVRAWWFKRLGNLTLSTKIQLYLNGAFILPLLFISILAISVMSSNKASEVDASFLKKSELVAQSLLPVLESSDNYNSLIQIPQELIKASKVTGQDIHLYGPSGYLLATSQPLLVKRGFISSYMNPQALALVVEARQNSTLLSESIGNFSFNTAYAAIRNPETGKVLGLVAIPFFESYSELKQQLSDVISSMLLLFTAMALLFGALSYYASQKLVVPLRLLTKRLKRTSLERQATPLEWNSKDEIGLLVVEYNNMLKNLDRSRAALVRSEKESAWREMARQVAHEIKNPLTPMKLTLQFLKQAIERKHEDVPKMVDRSIDTLLVQVDNLNDIASSFSAFAQMPTPKDELIDLAQIVLNTVSLYNLSNEAGVSYAIPTSAVPARGDARLLSRIFTNLILNAFQSVPDGREPNISVQFDLQDSGTALIAVSDNGIGIREANRGKIFMPDFSTKNGGSGIGLAVAKRGIEHLGGRIWFESSEGIGTTFYVELPTMIGGSMVEIL